MYLNVYLDVGIINISQGAESIGWVAGTEGDPVRLQVTWRGAVQTHVAVNVRLQDVMAQLQGLLRV